MSRTDAVAVTRVDSIHAIDPAEWSSLAEGGGLAVGYPFLASVEEDTSMVPAYLLARDENERLVAALPTYRWRADGENMQYYHPHAVATPPFLRDATDPSAWLPLRLIGTRAAYRNELLLHPDHRGSVEVRRRLAGELLSAALGELDREPPAARALMYLTADAASDLLPLLPPGMPLLLTGADTMMQVAWDDFDGYLSHLGWQGRRTVRRDMASFAAAGLETWTSRLGECCEEVGPLLGNLQRRHGVDVSDEQATGLLRAQVPTLDPMSLVFVSRRRGRAVGFALFYEWQGCLHARAAGFDYAATEGTATYFNLTFYLPIRHAIERRLRSLRWGLGTLESKRRRGAQLEPLWSAVAPPEALARAWLRGVRRWNEIVLQSRREEMGDGGHPLPAETWTLAGLAGPR